MHITNKSWRITYIKDYNLKVSYICIETKTVTRFECCLKAIAVFGPRSALYRNKPPLQYPAGNIAVHLQSGKEKEEWMKGGGVEERKKPKHPALFAMLCSAHTRESEGLFQRTHNV